MAGQHETISCPFCDKDTINCLYYGGVWSVKRTGRNPLGKGLSVSKSTDTWVISCGCSRCMKTAEEIEKELKTKSII